MGDDLILMLTAIIPATHKLFARAGLSIDHIDAFEVNEAFASVVLAWLRKTGADPKGSIGWAAPLRSATPSALRAAASACRRCANPAAWPTRR
jgi:acetyl-CoA acetyltransferase